MARSVAPPHVLNISDLRRLANRRGLTVRGPQKLFDTSLASIGLIYAQRRGVFRKYNDFTFERFWKRELDIEDREVMRRVLEECGAETAAFLALDEDPGMGIVVLELHDGSGDLDHVVFEIGGTEGMMGPELHGRAEQGGDYADGEESLRHVIVLPRALLATAAP